MVRTIGQTRSDCCLGDILAKMAVTPELSKVRLAKLRFAKRSSTESDEYRSPDDLFQFYHRLYGFTVDVAASHITAKVPTYFTRQNSALLRPWYGRAWCNPPYSALYPWVEKAHQEALHGCVTVMLLPGHRSESDWFHDFVVPYAQIEYIRGRLKFEHATKLTSTATFSSMIAVFPKSAAIPHEPFQGRFAR